MRGGRDGSSHFRVHRASVALLALPGAAGAGAAGTRGVAISWGWAVTLLFLVMAAKCKLNDSGDEEENTRRVSRALKDG
jgi:hypothetical protein